MQCPNCRGDIGIHLEVGEGRCTHCAARFYVVDKWRWLRVIACGVPAVVVNYGWYPVPCKPAVVVAWVGAVLLLGCLLGLLSMRILPLQVAAVRQEGPLRLDL